MSKPSAAHQSAQLRNCTKMISRLASPPQYIFPNQQLLAGDSLFPPGIAQFLLPVTEKPIASSLWELHSFGFQWPQQPTGSSLWELRSSACQWPNSQLEVPFGNCTVFTASLPGSPPEKMCNPCLLTVHAARPIHLEKCANLVVQPLLTVRSGKCAEHGPCPPIARTVPPKIYAIFPPSWARPCKQSLSTQIVCLHLSMTLAKFSSAFSWFHHPTSQPCCLSWSLAFEWSCVLVD